jgi:hypothetical protein
MAHYINRAEVRDETPCGYRGFHIRY